MEDAEKAERCSHGENPADQEKCGCGGAHVLVALPFIDVGMDDLVSRLLFGGRDFVGIRVFCFGHLTGERIHLLRHDGKLFFFFFLFHRVSDFF